VTNADLADVAVTLLLGGAGLFFAYSIDRRTRQEVKSKVAEKRFDAYGALWAETKVASPMRKVTGDGPLSPAERTSLYDRLTDWYYDCGNGMLMSQDTRNIYLAAKENLICEPERLVPHSLTDSVCGSSDPESVRGWASIRQISLLRTAMRGDVGIFTSPWGESLSQADTEFLTACKVNIWSEPWRGSKRADTDGVGE
jgi:hypothetical protein